MGAVVIPAGARGTVFSSDVTIFDDLVVEDDDSFFLSLPDENTVLFTIGANSTIEVIIENNDCKYNLLS